MRRLHSAKRKALLDIVGVWVCFFEMKSVRKVFSSTPLVATTNGVIELRFYELEQVCGACQISRCGREGMGTQQEAEKHLFGTEKVHVDIRTKQKYKRGKEFMPGAHKPQTPEANEYKDAFFTCFLDRSVRLAATKSK